MWWRLSTTRRFSHRVSSKSSSARPPYYLVPPGELLRAAVPARLLAAGEAVYVPAPGAVGAGTGGPAGEILAVLLEEERHACPISWSASDGKAFASALKQLVAEGVVRIRSESLRAAAAPADRAWVARPAPADHPAFSARAEAARRCTPGSSRSTGPPRSRKCALDGRRRPPSFPLSRRRASSRRSRPSGARTSPGTSEARARTRGPSPTKRRRRQSGRSPRASARRTAKEFLLDGVTGSGKTEVYLAALEDRAGRGPARDPPRAGDRARSGSRETPRGALRRPGLAPPQRPFGRRARRRVGARPAAETSTPSWALARPSSRRSRASASSSSTRRTTPPTSRASRRGTTPGPWRAYAPTRKAPRSSWARQRPRWSRSVRRARAVSRASRCPTAPRRARGRRSRSSISGRRRRREGDHGRVLLRAPDLRNPHGVLREGRAGDPSPQPARVLAEPALPRVRGGFSLRELLGGPHLSPPARAPPVPLLRRRHPPSADVSEVRWRHPAADRLRHGTPCRQIPGELPGDLLCRSRPRRGGQARRRRGSASGFRGGARAGAPRDADGRERSRLSKRDGSRRPGRRRAPFVPGLPLGRADLSARDSGGGPGRPRGEAGARRRPDVPA